MNMVNEFTDDFKFGCIYNKAVVYRAIKAGDMFVITWNFNGEHSMVLSKEEITNRFHDGEYYSTTK